MPAAMTVNGPTQDAVAAASAAWATPSARLTDSPRSMSAIRTFCPPSPSRPGPRAVSAAGAVLVMGGCRGLAAAVSRVIVPPRGAVPGLRAVLGLEGAAM
jgi:hypothetical protein